jgi:hypothetical protein
MELRATCLCWCENVVKCINKQKSNEMHLDCLLYHLIPPTCYGRCRPKHVGGIKLYNKQSECISLDFCLFVLENARSNTL